MSPDIHGIIVRLISGHADLRSGGSTLQWVAEHRQEFLDAYHQIRDPHGWERRYRYQRWLKYAARPAMFQINANTFVLHPSLLKRFEEVKREKQDASGLSSAVRQCGRSPA
jgi:hypothetical protein